ncbi:MAG: phage terminase large subunit [Clostridia bacterium]|nr:phage terminase large subunit [Clostridia bacterium]
MPNIIIDRIEKALKRNPDDVGAYADLVSAYDNRVHEGWFQYHADNKRLRGEISKAMRRLADRGGTASDMRRLNDAYWHSTLVDAPVDFDAYSLYIERNRDQKKRFYAPRRKQLLPIVNDLQALMDDELDILGISLPPGVGKTTTAIFLLTWVAGRWPEESNLTGSHSNAFVHGVYEECLRVMDKDGEYLWHDVFPNVPLSGTNAKDYRIDLGKRKRFETLEFTSIGSGNAGLYRAMRLLYCDDLVPGLEVALSKDRLDKLWETYATDLRQRKIGDHCKELHIATRWSVNDVIGRLERQYERNPRAKFVAVPALDENDESNFDYPYGVGFSTAFYREQRDVMDDASWRALYMNQPIEREGLLYHPDELRRYFELPDRQPDAILCVCDTKDRGTDYCSMPIAYQYGTDYYIEDVVFDNSNPEVVEARIVEKLLKNRVQMGRFESNSAGGRVAESIQTRTRLAGGRIKITTKFTTQNKETKIIMASPFVKEHFLFKDQTVIKDKEYRSFMSNVCSWTMNGKAKHDDGPDSLAMLADYVQNFASYVPTIFRRPF